MKKLLLLVWLLCVFYLSQAQEKQNFGGKEYIKKNGAWYSKEDHLVDRIVTVHLSRKPNSREIKLGSSLVLIPNKLGFADVRVPKDNDVIEFARDLAKNSLFDNVELNTIGKYVSIIPNDPNLGNQWYLNRIGVFDVWGFTMGSNCVKVAIIDSGVDWTHPDIGLGTDIYQNVALNSGEDVWSNFNNPMTGNGIDDDGNGFIDDWKGWNFDLASNNSLPSFFHGTHVAGIVSAKTNNSIGISGIAGGDNSPGTQLMSLCIGMSNPVGAVIDDAIIYAVDNGAKVIQMSLSVSSTTAIDAAINYAISNNVLVVCASGNDNAAVSYPASNNNVISVGATDQTDQRANFSNYGGNLTISAPGVGIFSTQLGSTYGTSDGTSFAAPIVSAVASLMLVINPNLTPSSIRSALINNADKTGGYSYSAGRSNELGYGRLNAINAIDAIAPKIIGSNNLCNTEVYSITGLPSGCTIVGWTVSNSIATLVSLGSSVTLSKNYDGVVELNAIISNGCSNYIIRKKIIVGVPTNAGNGVVYFNYGVPVNPLDICQAGYEVRGNFQYKDDNGNDSEINPGYEFEVINNDPNFSFSTTNGVIFDYYINPYFTGTLYVPVKVKNTCGWSSDIFYLEVIVGNCNWSKLFTVSPNPTSAKLTVVKQTDTRFPSKIEYKFSAKLYDEKGVVKLSGKNNGVELSIDTKDLPNGRYFLHIYENGNTYKSQILVRH